MISLQILILIILIAALASAMFSAAAPKITKPVKEIERIGVKCNFKTAYFEDNALREVHSICQGLDYLSLSDEYLQSLYPKSKLTAVRGGVHQVEIEVG